MLGGGCNERLEYVELIVDGDVVQRATGACSEAMNRVIWDVSLYTGRSGQIRIVDASSGHWGHINVDDFRFDWAMQQYVESDRAGAAFVWRRKRIGSDEPCIVRSDMPAYLHPWAFSPLDCEYQFQQTLLVRVLALALVPVVTIVFLWVCSRMTSAEGTSLGILLLWMMTWGRSWWVQLNNR